MSYSTSPINPVDFMQDIAINKLSEKNPTNNTGKAQLFKELLAEAMLKDMYNENSVYKPDTEEEDYGGFTSIYKGYMQKQVTAQLVEQGFLNDEVFDGRK